MKKILFLMFFCVILFAKNVEIFDLSTYFKSPNQQIYAISLKKSVLNTKLLIADNEEAKSLIAQFSNQGLRTNEHFILLIKSKNFNVLIDTGYNDTQEDLIAALRELGLDTRSITHIILTHGHSDHLGGILKEGQNIFPNAKLFIDEKEKAYWLTSSNQNTIDTLNSFKQTGFMQGEILKQDGIKISSLKAYGHTPGHNIILLEYQDEKLAFIADIFHAFDIQIQNPNIAITYDVDPKEAIASRKHLLEFLKTNQIQAVGTHMPELIFKAWQY